MGNKMSKPQKESYREGYRLGLYTGGKLARLGVDVKEPREAKKAESGGTNGR